jgi:hypothetical protein
MNTTLDGNNRLFFAFEDGQLGYNCKRCGSRCCHRHGFAGSHAEITRLIERYPAVGLFSAATGTADHLRVSECGTHCLLLHRDGSCRVQNDLGYEQKPFVCKLFPANHLSLLGQTLLVDVHSLCPLELRTDPAVVSGVSAENGLVPLSHQAITTLLHQYESIARFSATTIASNLEQEQIDRLISGEQTWRAKLASLAPHEIAPLYIAQTLHRETPTQHLPAATTEPDLEAFLQKLSRFLGGESGHKIDQQVAFVATQLFSRLRCAGLHMLKHCDESWVRARLPRLYLVSCLLLQRASELSPLPPDPRLHATQAPDPTLHNDVTVAQQELLWWLCHVDQIPRFISEPADAKKLTLCRSLVSRIQRLLSFIYRHNTSERLTLGQILERFGERGSAAVRLLRALPVFLMKHIAWEQP